eukprot:TRINITY_DN39156_c0_g1_i1.p1 TRINITY_DN39156_c0_g1~~TRINITY_DN39156_c0_g1_i1.p1  ORF type:complete len:109 (+),score=14.80 TRINITY_DN39156_c0_g1_i1:25-327(+)
MGKIAAIVYREHLFAERYMLTGYIAQHLVLLLPARFLGYYWHDNQWYFLMDGQRALAPWLGVFLTYVFTVVLWVTFHWWETRGSSTGTLEWMVRRAMKVK